MKYSAFISYRRIGGAEKAELLKAVLCKKGYRAKDIFMDTYTIHTGNYVQNIEQAIAQSRNFIVIITKGCFDNLDQDGIWVHELKLAKDLGLNIIPIYFDGIRKLQPSDLPAPISDLPLDNAVIYSHDYADASYERICSFMAGYKPINWLKALRNNIISIVSVVLAIVVVLVMGRNKAESVNNNTTTPVVTNSHVEEKEVTTPIVNETPTSAEDKNATVQESHQTVEFNIILSTFLSQENDILEWATFAKMPGFKMVSDYVEMLSDDDSDHYLGSFELTYELYLTINGKNLYEDAFGRAGSCIVSLHGPRPCCTSVSIDIGYGYGGNLQNIEEYIKLMYPSCRVLEQKKGRTMELCMYEVRENLFICILDDYSGNAIGGKDIFISKDKSEIERIYWYLGKQLKD